MTACEQDGLLQRTSARYARCSRMVFSSIEFLFVFLPIFLLAQSLLPFRNATYVAFSLLFYFVGEGWYVAVVLASACVNYALGRAIEAQPDARRRAIVTGSGVALNLLSLFLFKYAGFFCENLATLAAIATCRPAWHLPLGVSFFTFHAISYLVDIHRRDAHAERSFVHLGLYMLMFPQLIAGPILRFHSIAPQLGRREVGLRHVHFGLLLFCFGLAQKVLLADTLARLADGLFAHAADLGTSGAWLAVLAYTLQIYFDFAGYSNMAVGLGWTTGFDLPKNFDYPYASASITEFWRRWHISLSRWFRDYLYVPLGGNRLGRGRTYANLLCVFLLCGLWHGAAWTFIAWGAYHGAWLVLERLGGARVLAKLPRVLRHGYAVLVVMVGWVLFRADSLSEAGLLLRRMFWLVPSAPLQPTPIMNRTEMLALCCALVFCLPPLPRQLARWLGVAGERPWPQVAPQAYLGGAVVGVVVFVAIATKVLTGAYSPFIYFRF
ncbi:MAG: MBOAT family protein [Deltaproteobacteria bacterium]